jgi:protein gp37
VSAGCDNCYAMHFAHRFSKVPGHAMEGLTVIRQDKVDWSSKIKLNEEALLAPLRRKKPTRYFVNSMSDLFHHGVPDEYIAAVFGVMSLCPQHTFMILTKRIDRAPKFFSLCGSDKIRLNYYRGCLGEKYLTDKQRFGIALRQTKDFPLPNVWLGVSVEDQKTADERIPILLRTPAAVRWISAEPLLGALDLERYLMSCNGCDNQGSVAYAFDKPGSSLCLNACIKHGEGPSLDWVVVGGESGSGARRFNLAWAQSILKQCRAADVSCFIKQLGSDPFYHVQTSVEESRPGFKLSIQSMEIDTIFHFKDRKGGDMEEWPEDLRVREYPGSEVAA